MRLSGPVVVLLTMGSLTLYAGCSPRVWSPQEARQRLLAIFLGLIFLGMGLAGLFGFMEIND